MTNAIEVSNLSKSYQLYSSPVDILKDAILGGKRHVEKVVLDSLSFSIKKGEVVGIIGKNGAGKSTLLKILAGTLNLSSGSFFVNGKISAILELGTGFHPEYTGRENIILGGMCLGMTKREVLSKQKQIIEFSELEDVIDQPFKTYSSGMQARLTFSTAISVSPDILIIDEALAAGDSAFVEKCLGRIDEIARSGATVLLVTHNTNLIPRFGSRAIWIENGSIKLDGDAAYVSKQYEIDSFLRVKNNASNSTKDCIGDQLVRLRKLSILGSPCKEDIFYQGDPIAIVFDIESSIHTTSVELYVQITRDDGLVVWTFTSYEFMDLNYKLSSIQLSFIPGLNRVTVQIPHLLFNVGRYNINFGIEPFRDTPRIVDYHDWVRYASSFGITKNSAVTVNKAFDSPILPSYEYIANDLLVEPPTAPSIQICDYPFPYKSVLSISNDCEFLDAAATYNILKILSDPNLYDLEISTSMFWYLTNSLCHSSISFYEHTSNIPSAHSSLILDLCKSGWIDANHSYGDFDNGGFSRDLVLPVLDIITKENLLLPIYTNHGSNKNFQNIGTSELNNYQAGDIPSSIAYHLDLTIESGARFFWLDNLISSNFNFVDSPFIDLSCRDDNKIYGFNRYRGLVGKSAPTMESFPDQVTFSMLDKLVEDRGHTVIYQHFGVSRRTSSGKFIPLSYPYISPEAHKIFNYLSSLQRNKQCLTMSLSRYLTYMHMRNNIDVTYVDSAIYINYTEFKGDVSVFDGLSFIIPDSLHLERVFVQVKNLPDTLLPLHKERSGKGSICYYRPYIKLDRSIFDD